MNPRLYIEQTSSSISVHVNGTVINSITGVCIALVMLFHLAFLTRYPIIFIDEPWFANAAWNWVTTGVNFDTMHTGTLDQFGVPWLNRPFLGEAPWAGFMALFGLGFFQIRLVSWLLGCLLLITLILVGRLTYSLSTGLLAALFLSLSYPFLLSSHYARPDILLAVIVVAAYGLAITAFKKNHWWLHVLTGFLLGSALDIHPNTLLFAAGLVVLYAYNYGKTFFRQKGTWLCALGGIVGIFIYVAIHILPDPQAFISFYAGFTSEAGSHALPIQTLSPIDLLVSLYQEIKRYRFGEYSLDFILIGSSVVYLAIRHLEYDRYLLLYIVTVFLGFVLVVGNKYEYYGILFYPFLMLIVAETFLSLFQVTRNSNLTQTFIITLLSLFIINNTIHLIRLMVEYRNYDYYDITNEIKTVFPAKARVLGNPQWWLGLSEYDYLSTQNFLYYHRYQILSINESLNTMKPDFFIVDDIVRFTLTSQESGLSQPFTQQEFDFFLDQFGHPLLEFDTLHGQIQVYQIQELDWVD